MKPYNIPSATESTARDLAAGAITLRQAAEELYRCGLIPFIDEERAAQHLRPYTEPEAPLAANQMCTTCPRHGADCTGTTAQHWTGCARKPWPSR